MGIYWKNCKPPPGTPPMTFSPSRFSISRFLTFIIGLPPHRLFSFPFYFQSIFFSSLTHMYKRAHARAPSSLTLSPLSLPLFLPLQPSPCPSSASLTPASCPSSTRTLALSSLPATRTPCTQHLRSHDVIQFINECGSLSGCGLYLSFMAVFVPSGELKELKE